MTLGEFINVAKYSELRSLAVKDDPVVVTAFANLGLLELYSIFNLRTDEVIINLKSGVTIYDMPEDFMYITGAYELSGSGSNSNAVPLPINEEGNLYSVNTINFNQVQIPLSVTGAYIGIIYAQKPPVLSSEDLTARLPIPDHLIQCLLHFVAFKGHGGVHLDGQQEEGDVYYQRFRRSCDDIKKQGTSIASDDLSMDNRIALRGFP